MERDVREFLGEFSPDELVDLEVLWPDKRFLYLLNHKSVVPLIRLMLDRGVTKLVSTDGRWFLAIEGTFRIPLPSEEESDLFEELVHEGRIFTVEVTFNNPRSEEEKGGLVRMLGNKGSVFTRQNERINPYFDSNSQT